MRKLGLAIAAVAMVALAGSASAVKPGTTGSGLPLVDMSDSFQMTIHAVDKCPKAGYDGSNRHTIVVQGLTEAEFADAVAKHVAHLPDLSDLNDIELTKSDSADSFQVIDGNACDNDSALFALPPLVATTYDVFIKLVGKPGNKFNPVLCASDLVTGVFLGNTDFYCNTGTVRVRSSGNDKYVNVNDELLDILTADLHTFLFNDPAGLYFWDWSATKGGKALVRFVAR